MVSALEYTRISISTSNFLIHGAVSWRPLLVKDAMWCLNGGYFRRYENQSIEKKETQRNTILMLLMAVLTEKRLYFELRSSKHRGGKTSQPFLIFAGSLKFHPTIKIGPTVF